MNLCTEVCEKESDILTSRVLAGKRLHYELLCPRLIIQVFKEEMLV